MRTVFFPGDNQETRKTRRIDVSSNGFTRAGIVNVNLIPSKDSESLKNRTLDFKRLGFSGSLSEPILLTRNRKKSFRVRFESDKPITSRRRPFGLFEKDRIVDLTGARENGEAKTHSFNYPSASSENIHTISVVSVEDREPGERRLAGIFKEKKTASAKNRN